MKRNKKWIALLLCASVLLLSGCRPAPERPLSVWMIVKTTTTAFWKAAFAGAMAAKSEYALDLTAAGPDTEEDYEAENRYIEKAVAEGADAIVLSAISYTGNAAAVEKAVDAGVAVIVIDSDVKSDRVASRIGTDNREAGRMACRSALQTPEQELHVGIINIDAGVRNGQEREEGFREVLYQDERVREIVTINVPAEAGEACRRTRELLQQHPQINVLVSFNEPLSVGAARAVDQLGLQDEVQLVGFDSNLECIDKLQSGVISSLVVQNPYAMGYLGVEMAWKILNGEPGAEYLPTPAVVVTREEMFDLENQKVLFPFD